MRAATRYRSFLGNALAYAVFGFGMCGSPLPVWAFHDSFMAQISSQGMGADYLATLEAAATPEMMIAMFAVTFVCGLRALPCAGHVQEALREGGARVMEARALRRDGLGEGTLLGRRKRKGFLALDPRTLMGVLVAASVLAFAEKSLTVELCLVCAAGLLQRLPGTRRWRQGSLRHTRRFSGSCASSSPTLGGVAATMFTISFTFSRKIYLCLMVGALLISDSPSTGLAQRLRS